MWLLLLVVAAIFFLRWWLSLNFNYWNKRNVPNPPVSIIFGNMTPAIFMKKSMGQIYTDIYWEYPKAPYVGVYKVRQPAILVRDPELIKLVVMKDFSSFHDNDIEIDEKVDMLFGKNPFCLKGQRWKVVRNQITPCFTGGKLKAMFPLINEIGKKYVKHIEGVGQESQEAKELAAKFTCEDVASCAFGLEGNCFNDPQAEFLVIGRKLLKPSTAMALKQLAMFLYPSLASVLKVKFFTDEITNYFRGLVKETLSYREKNKIFRGDFLDFMVQLKSKSNDDEFTDDDITAHAAGFFGDGFETSSIVLNFAYYELASNPDEQNKLRQEVQANFLRHGDFTYDGIQEMSYLDCVVMETLRKHPPVPFLGKLCTETYKLPPVSGTGPGVTVEVGTPVILPIYALHHDPKYFNDPERFNPDNFTEGNKQGRTKYVYLPLGEGPRACLGQRFGILQIKVALAHIIRNFELRLDTKKTALPLKMDPGHFMQYVVGGVWIKFYKITT